MVNGELRFELVNQLGLIKSLLKDSVKEHEISQDMRVKIMGKIGEIKSILYSDLEFKKRYQIYATSGCRRLIG